MLVTAVMLGQNQRWVTRKKWSNIHRSCLNVWSGPGRQRNGPAAIRQKINCTACSTAACNNHSKKKILDKAVALRKVHISIHTVQEEGKELEEILRHMGCLGILEKSWRVRHEEMVRELVTEEVNQTYFSTIRGRLDR